VKSTEEERSVNGLNRTLWAVTAALATVLSSPALSQNFEFNSGPHRVALLELFTSEGCSSCPPADRWLSQLVDDRRLWHTIVPVAFHVDYWNYIGWEDAFAQEKFGIRQRDYRRRGHIRSVYTPGFVVAGQEWRGWVSSPVLHGPTGPDPGSLEVTGRDGKVLVRFYPTASGQVAQPTAHIARLGFDLFTEVEAGENHGRKLHHNFVVLGHAQRALKSDGNGLTVQFELPETKVKARREALAIWVSRRDDPRPIQALGGWL